jgi:hypothetical protein
MGTNIVVPVGLRLRIAPGVQVKLGIDQSVHVDGALDVEGSEGRPVILTDYRDDSVGGDSNGDGAASSPAPNWWRGVTLAPGAAPSRLEHLHVRYGGRNGFAGVTCGSPLAELLHLRVERCQNIGYTLTAADRADFLTAWSNVGSGVRLDGGSFDLRHATVNGCSTGIQKLASAWTGLVVNSIAFGNTTNFLGSISGQVIYSTAIAGGLGNLNADPLFVDAPNGDLHLTAGSPCIAAGDPASTVDADCTAPDMGAYPRLGVAAPFTYCTGKANSAGCTPFLTFSGYASASDPEPFYVRCYDLVNAKNGLFYYGFSGAQATPFQGGTKCVASPTKRLPIQNSGGTAVGNDCTGSYQFDFNARIQSGVDPLLVPGATVNVQCWYRDPAVPSDTGLSDGGQFDVCN